ncbi:AAA family ATPase [Paraburkholderia sp. SG-MS1]|uniref:AAA family ATPase n=1 Tax=Paraburkholderia sp. SG-MS1 TaxID=2023741 RepID=UPI00144728B9|nr:AAA family ATPase [Paraburkholderia sp. SG-MS1]
MNPSDMLASPSSGWRSSNDFTDMAKKNHKPNRGGPPALNNGIGAHGHQGHHGHGSAGAKTQTSPLLNTLWGAAKIPQEESKTETTDGMLAASPSPVSASLPESGRLDAIAATLRNQQARLDEERHTADAISAGFEAREAALAKREGEYGQREALQSEREESLSARDAALTHREREIEDRERDARHGFARQNQRSLHELRDENARLEARRASLAVEIEERLTLSQNAFQTESDAVRRRLAERADRIAGREAELDAREEGLEESRRQFDAHRRTREQMESMSRERVRSEFEGELAQRDQEIDRLRKKNESLARQLDEANDTLDGYDDLRDTLGDRAPAELLQELEKLEDKNKALKRQVGELEAQATIDEFNAACKERDRAVEEVNQLRIELAGYKQIAHTKSMEALQRQRAADELHIMQVRNQAMKLHLDELETTIGKMTDGRKSASAFVELSRMDVDAAYQIERPVNPVDDLKTFTDELRIRLACVQPDNPLYFRAEDLQLFLGGLAMSQLHVFQGISGTGKTSLAKAFAKVVGGECQDIAVQAGWRDRSDLLGHYNTFERRFAEKECLQAMYRAATPSAKNRVNIILLDEMNLSRPEQYFADFLSALEKEGDDRLIRLVETSPANPPQQLRDGREILVPENLWFIGTANQDETTNELADKTHDRAFVLELPRHEGRFEIAQRLRPRTIAFESLDKAFKATQKSAREAIDERLDIIGDSDLTSVLAQHFGIGWGNRFERQARKFLPVVAAAGGSIAQGLDHLLAIRVFRSGKVTGRYDTSAETLERVQQALLDVFARVTDGAFPERCLDAIEADLKRLERGA